MRLGALVVRKNMWGIDSKSLGLVIGRAEGTELRGGVWTVLWTMKSTFKIQDHYGDALADVSHRLDSDLESQNE